MSDAVLTAVLFTDLVDSTAVASRLGPERNEELRQSHFALLRDAIAATGGTEVKNLGDGLMVAYGSPSQALSCATGMQQAIARHNERSSDPLMVRIGLSVGEAFEEDGDYFGEPVVEAARLCAAADGAQILTTALIQTMLGRHAPVEFRPVGSLELKGIPEPVPAVEVQWEPLVAESRVPLPSVLAGVTRAGLFGFVGREAELALVDDTRKVAFTEPRLQTVLVAGEAGIGKTSMIARTATEAHGAGAVVLLGRCDEDVSAPYRIWIEALSHLFEHLGASVMDGLSPMHQQAIVRLVPAHGTHGSTSGEAESDRLVLMHAVETLLRETSRDSPIVLVLDDLHWADAASLHVLRHLIAGAGEMAVLVLCTYRHTDLVHNHPLTGLLADLHRQPGVSRVKLAGLDDSETVELVSSAAGHELDDRTIRFAHTLRRETDGNPFFTGELLRHLGESGAVTQDDDGRWVAVSNSDETPLPASVREVVARRVERLGPDAGRVLSTASILGRDFTLELLAHVAKRSEDDVLDVLEAATAGAILGEDEGAHGSYRFAHALIQRTLYEDMGAARRARMHQRVAEALEAEPVGRGPNHTAELARHWVAAVRPADHDKALHYVIEAADDALAALAPDDAIRWYRQALDLASRRSEPDPLLRGRLLVGLGTAQRHVGAPEYRDSLIDAGDLARRSDDADLLVSAILAADRGVAGTSGADVEWVEATEAALEAIGPGDSVARARLLSMLSQTIHAREWERRRDLSTEAVAVARRLDDANTLIAVLPVAYQHYGPEARELRLVDTAEAIELADRQGNPIARCNALFHRIDACVQVGDLVEVDARLAELSTEARRTGLPLHLWQLHMTTSLRALIDGRCDEAESEADVAFEIGSAGGHVEAIAAYGAQLLEIRRQQGRLEEMVEFLEEAAGDNAAVPGFRQLLGTVYSDLGRLDEAHELLAQDRETDFSEIPRDAAWLTTTGCCATTAASLREPEACRVLYDRLLPHEQQISSVYATMSGATARHLGRLAGVLGRDREAEAHFEVALDLHEQIDAPYWVARTQLDLAELLMARRESGDEERARSLIEEARATADSYGHGSLVERASAIG